MNNNNNNNNNNSIPHAPSFLVDQERMVGVSAPAPARPRTDEGNHEVRNYYLELARQLGLVLPELTNNVGNPPTGALQNPAGTYL